MSNTNSDSGVIASSSVDSASDISISTKTNTKSCLILDGDIEKQCYLQVPELPPFPDEWKPPSHTCAWLFFTAICWFSVGKSDLENFWLKMEGKSWKEYNRGYRQLPLHVHVGILFCCTRFALAMKKPPVFIHQPDDTSIVPDYHYFYVFFLLMILCSVLGLFCVTLLSLFNRSIELREEIEMEGQKRFQLSLHEVLIYVVLSQIAFLGPLLSLHCFLVGGIVRVWA